MGDNPLDLAILGVQDEIANLPPSDDNHFDSVVSYNRGYRDALEDTLDNLNELARALSR